MAARFARAPKSVAGTDDIGVEDPATSRALDAVRESVERLQDAPRTQTIEFDLVVGLNAINHSLGRPVKALVITPTVASSAFAFALQKNHIHADRQCLIEIVGVDQPNATVVLS